MTSPFDARDADHSVLVNAEGQHCLWPAEYPVPAGWARVHGPGDRRACLAYVTEHDRTLARPAVPPVSTAPEEQHP